MVVDDHEPYGSLHNSNYVCIFVIWPCSKSSICLTTYPPLNENVICEGSLLNQLVLWEPHYCWVPVEFIWNIFVNMYVYVITLNALCKFIFTKVFFNIDSVGTQQQCKAGLTPSKIAAQFWFGSRLTSAATMFPQDLRVSLFSGPFKQRSQYIKMWVLLDCGFQGGSYMRKYSKSACQALCAQPLIPE